MRALEVTGTARNREGTSHRLTLTSFVGYASVATVMVGFPALGSVTLLEGDVSLWGAQGTAYGIFFVTNL